MFYLVQKFRGGNMGKVEVMGRLGSPRGWVRGGGGGGEKLNHKLILMFP